MSQPTPTTAPTERENAPAETRSRVRGQRQSPADAPASDPALQASSTCTHCGLPLPAPAQGDGPHFCCAGCRAVYALLAESGLSDFYTLRARLGDERPAAPVLDPEPAGRYAHYDDAEFQARFAPSGDQADLHLDGVHCAACVWVMDQLPRVIPGVREARLDYGRARLHLRWDPDTTTLGQVGAALHRLGYASSALGRAAEEATRRADRAELIRLGAMGAIAGNVMLFSFALYAGADADPRYGRAFEWLSALLAIPAVTYGALPFYRAAWSGLKMRVAHLDLPIAIGLLTGYLGSVWATLTGGGQTYYDSVTALVFLLLAGRYAQRRGQRVAMDRAEQLAALTPGEATRWDGANWVKVPASALRRGDRVRVRAGETLPVDGRVLVGRGHLDQSLLTGESRPVAAEPGTQAYAGTVSVGDLIELEATASGADTRLGRLLDLVERADADRAPILRRADRISGRFVLAVLALAAIGALIWSQRDPTRVFDVVISLLVVTCPCALGLATPVALAVARGRAAASGVLVRTTAAIERLAAVDHVYFDKTGTLTEGRLSVLGITWSPNVTDQATILRWVSAIEARSTHPVARALWRHLGDPSEAGDPAPTNQQEKPGSGVSAQMAGHQLFIGAPNQASRPLCIALNSALRAALERGHTPVLIERDEEPVALIALGDTLRPGAHEAISRLKAKGIRVGILSGDHPQVAAAIGSQLGITETQGGQTPEDKANQVAKKPGVAMVGDGFNDAAALRAASVGIAVQGGAEVSLQVADIFLSRPGPNAVVDAIEGAQRALRIVHRNLRFSLTYNLVFATLALAGQISPLAAAVLMPLSSLTVITSSLIGRSFQAHRANAPALQSPATPNPKPTPASTPQTPAS